MKFKMILLVEFYKKETTDTSYFHTKTENILEATDLKKLMKKLLKNFRKIRKI